MTAALDVLKIVEIDEASIMLRSDDIVHIVFRKGVTIDVELQHKLVKAYWEICESKKRPFIFEAMDDVTLTKEARENAPLMEDKSPVIAYAILTNSLAYKLVAQFFLKVNKPKTPIKIFRDFDDAIIWLQQFKI